MTDRPIRLQPRQEHFAKLIADGKTGRAAYLEAYTRPGVTITPAAADSNACRALRSDRVQARIAQLHRDQQAVASITADRLTAELWATAEEARRLGQPAAAVSAFMGIAKILGFLVEKTQIDLSVISKPMASPTHEIDLSPEDWAARWQAPLLSGHNGHGGHNGSDKNGGGS